MSNMPRDDEGEFLPARFSRPLPAAYQRPQVITGAISETDDVAVLMHYLRVLWKRKGILLLCTILGITAGLGKSLWTTPLYSARTSLQIEEVQEPFNANGSKGLDLGTKVGFLQSRKLASRVQTRLSEKPLPHPPNTRDPLSSVRRLLSLGDPTQSITWDQAVAWAAGELRVSTGRESRILSIESKSPNPEAAAQFTNMLAAEYIKEGEESRSKSYESKWEWLKDSQGELRAEVLTLEGRLRDFAKTNGLIVTGSEDATEDRLKRLQDDLGQAMTEKYLKESKYNASVSPTKSQSLPEILDSGPLSGYEAELTKKRQELAVHRTTLTDQNPKIVKVLAEIDSLETARDNERKNVLGRIKNEYDIAAKQTDTLEQAFKEQAKILSGLAEPLVQYRIWVAELDAKRRLYNETMLQGKQLSLASAFSASNASIVDTATAALAPQTPNWRLWIGLGGIGGFFCGTVLIIGLSLLDARIQDCGSLEMQLGLRQLGVIPSASISTPQIGQMLDRSIKAITQGRSDKNSTSVLIPNRAATEKLELVTWTHRNSVISEAVRAVMTSILFSSNGHGPQTLVITSPNKQEGKTTVVTNLAIALAEINRRVLLIDADMRLPRVHQIFDLPNTYGLSDFLHERRPIEEYHEEELVRKTHVPNLYTMLAGPARSNLARLLYSTRMKELILRFRGTFDMILIDSAPVLLVPDARILSRASDGIILVIRAHRTHQEAATAAVRSFEDDGSRILGTIFNDWNPKRSAYGKYGGYGAYGAYER